MDKLYTIREFQSFCKAPASPGDGFIGLPINVFDALERFILENRTESEDGAQAWELLSLSLKRGTKVISARNYVGTITLTDGTTIEILPKLDNADDLAARRVFLKMLRTVRDLPYKSFEKSYVETDRISLFEVYIRMFLRELGLLLKRGIKFGYVSKEENLPFMKGKLVFSRHIKQNLAHGERFYVAYDEFQANRPENRLIKRTIEYVQHFSSDNRNRKECRRYLSMMDEIESSTDVQGDFSKYTANRNMAEYETIMRWCRVFLLNRSFTSFRGKEVAFALLFPMETLFESFVADQMRRFYLENKSIHVSAQDHGYHLFDYPKRFALRPDLVVTNRTDNTNVVLDTKWKMLSPQYSNTYGISQPDMYQMYIYHKKYHPKKVLLIYPFNTAIRDSSQELHFLAKEDNGMEVIVEAVFFDLMNVTGSLDRIGRAMGY